MASGLKIIIKPALEDIKPDGDICIVCGDRAYLSAKRIVFYGNDKLMGKSRAILCRSCGERAEDDLREVGL